MNIIKPEFLNGLHIMASKRRKNIKIVIAALLGLCLCVFLFKGLFCDPSFRHIWHLTFPPEDLYEPIVVDEFKFHEKGFEKRYVLKPKYLDGYVLEF